MERPELFFDPWAILEFLMRIPFFHYVLGIVVAFVVMYAVVGDDPDLAFTQAAIFWWIFGKGFYYLLGFMMYTHRHGFDWKMAVGLLIYAVVWGIISIVVLVVVHSIYCWMNTDHYALINGERQNTLTARLLNPRRQAPPHVQPNQPQPEEIPDHPHRWWDD